MKRIIKYDKEKFILGINASLTQDVLSKFVRNIFLDIEKSVNAIYHIKRLKKKKHNHINRYRTIFLCYSTFINKKTLQLIMEITLFILIYDKLEVNLNLRSIEYLLPKMGSKAKMSFHHVYLTLY
jgi:hypothetical protein